jgi:hypothetical protein
MRDIELRTWEREPMEGHRDHLAEALVMGTAIAPMPDRPERAADIAALPIMRLGT